MPASTRTSPDYFPMLVMHTVLGANASSRLFMNLREAKGLHLRRVFKS